MKFEILPLRSLKTKVVLITLVAFVISIWLIASYISTKMREDLQGILGDQQLATVSLAAANLNTDLQVRIDALQMLAKSFNAGLLARPDSMQASLEQGLTPEILFNAGIFVTRSDGTAIAEVPKIGRVGLNYMDRDHVAAALTQGGTTVGRPVVGKAVRAPSFAITVPIRDAQGKVIGALAGATDLSKPNFMDNINESHYGKSGGYLVVDPKHKLFVTATNKALVMGALPANGVNPVLDRRLLGFDGAAVNVNSLGIEVLTSSWRIPSTGWFLIATLPTQEAFAPIHAMQQSVLKVTALITTLACGLVWLLMTVVLKRQFAPMISATQKLDESSRKQEFPQPLPVTSHDEVGSLIDAFNRLLINVGQRDDALKRSEHLLHDSQKAARIASYIHNIQAGTIEGTSTLDEIFGITKDYPHTPKAWLMFVHPDFMQTVHDALLDAIHSRKPFDAEYKIIRPSDGAERWMHSLGQIARDDRGNAVSLIGTVQDITERKATEEAQRIAATAFESQQGMFITDSNQLILRVNKVFTDVTGYAADEAVGQTPRLLNSGRQDAGFYAAMWDSIKRSGAWQGEIWNRRKDGTVYAEHLTVSSVKNDDGVLTHYVGAFSDLTSYKAAEEQIHNLSYTDLLTGLPNRRHLIFLLQQTIDAAQSRPYTSALLLVDLDHFKNLNDSLGHAQGDLLLLRTARRLGRCLDAGDTVVRLGSDEFAVLLEQLSPDPQKALKQAEVLANKMLAALNEPYQLAGSLISCTASVGITFFGEKCEETLEPLKRAELAMYQAKSAGRNTLRFYDPRMQTLVDARVNLEAALREAILKEQFTLYYQAQVSDSEGIVGVEALLRWADPKRGMVSPAEFIPLAEETDLILTIGAWVLKTACQQLTSWAAQPAMAYLSIAVNVSARQFRERNFVDQVLAALQSNGANPQRLKLELTESVLIADVEDVIAKMTALKAHGVGFTIDDFGTGYSSLVYLKRLPLEQLKIDQGFVRDILIDADDAAIARAIIAMAGSMELGVIAEGVETAAQRDLLASLGCHSYQGHLFSKPLPIAEFEALMQRT